MAIFAFIGSELSKNWGFKLGVCLKLAQVNWELSEPQPLNRQSYIRMSSLPRELRSWIASELLQN
jgi:hypothetical protein